MAAMKWHVASFEKRTKDGLINIKEKSILVTIKQLSNCS
jgi:hypothetical protein